MSLFLYINDDELVCNTKQIKYLSSFYDGIEALYISTCSCEFAKVYAHAQYSCKLFLDPCDDVINSQIMTFLIEVKRRHVPECASLITC